MRHASTKGFMLLKNQFRQKATLPHTQAQHSIFTCLPVISVFERKLKAIIYTKIFDYIKQLLNKYTKRLLLKLTPKPL